MAEGDRRIEAEVVVVDGEKEGIKRDAIPKGECIPKRKARLGKDRRGD